MYRKESDASSSFHRRTAQYPHPSGERPSGDSRPEGRERSAMLSSASGSRAEGGVLRWLPRSFSTAMGWRRLIMAVTFGTAAVTLLVLTSVVPYSTFLVPPSVEPTYTAAVTEIIASNVAEVSPPPPPPPEAVPPVGTSLRASQTPPDASNSASPLNSRNSTPSSQPVLVSPSVGDSDRKKTGVEGKQESRGRRERQRPLWSLPPDEALAYAKKEIESAPIVSDDPELHGPLFRNVSTFKRSYELMEQILKVYIYQDGSTPIFHTPQLRGIYASEGWFMKLMEENKQFVVKDPSRAHLFYLPYSSRQLELALYVPNSHNLKPLAIFLKDYVNSVAANYPFWNRTHGSDHFLVACHDWGPYTTTQHEELLRNAIKALCNADVSEKIFLRGRDVSLPETSIRTPKKPLRDLGGKPVSQRSILAFYAGNMHGRVRPILKKYWDGTDEDMKIYCRLPNRVSKVMSYIQHMKTSKFCICPMGFEVNSPRIVEAIYYECVPVIIADNFVPPLDEVLDWSAFSVIVEEKDIPNLKDILLSISLRRYISLHRNVQRLQKHFLWHAKPVKYDLFHMILHSVWFNRLNQIVVHK